MSTGDINEHKVSLEVQDYQVKIPSLPHSYYSMTLSLYGMEAKILNSMFAYLQYIYQVSLVGDKFKF